MNTSTLIKTTAAALCLVASVSLADDRRANHARVIQGHIGSTFTLPASGNPAVIRVDWVGEGGLAHIGKVRAWSTDEAVGVLTGRLTAHITFEDDEGDQLLTWYDAASGFQPDGRITFEGPLAVLGGSGPYEHASGTLTLSGWARSTDTSTGAGIGFFTVDGTIRAKELKRWAPLTLAESGIGEANGLDFVYHGAGRSPTLGRYTHAAQSVAGPVNGFVGIINNKFTVVVPIEEVITVRGAELHSAGFEFVYFELLTLPDGSPAPDFSKPSTFETYATLAGGTRRFEEAQGVLKTVGTLTPTSPTRILATATSQGLARIKGTERGR